jgi:hypothetical protein
MKCAGAPRKVATSISLEVVIYFGWWYDVAFWLTNIGLFIYKGALVSVLQSFVPFPLKQA